MSENITYYEPTEHQLAKFHHINSISYEDWQLHCVSCGDCSICHMAIHQYLISTEKHHCTYGISENKFRILMSSADCAY